MNSELRAWGWQHGRFVPAVSVARIDGDAMLGVGSQCERMAIRWWGNHANEAHV